MASLQKKGDAWYCQFIYAKKRHTITIGPVSDTEALQWQSRTENLLMRLKQHMLEVPRGVGISDFILHDGKPPVDAAVAAHKETTFHELREAYEKTVSNGSIERNTLYTAKIHLAHIEKSLGKDFLLTGLTLGKLQAHVERRQKDVGAVTIKKELDTLRGAWNWALRMKWVDQMFPAGVVYPKTDEKLPFMPWSEIERRIKAGGDAETLWECLYLDTTQVAELLIYVKAKKAPLWVYPMIAMAAHTGARRSELIRSRLEDIDFASGTVTVREKKRARGTSTTRRVPISNLLKDALKGQMKRQKGKVYLFGDGSKPLSVQSTHKAFERALQKSKWQVIRGWHTLRHSFISALASKGIDQRIIDDFVGHQTEGQRRRYRHLYPNVTREALTSVFV